MTGSFLFVKPSDPEGKHETAYSSDKSPRYPYDRASWEWLLERALRRTLLPWALMKSHSRVLLYGHEDKYSMHRWGSYGESNYYADPTPDEYQSVGGPGSINRKTDADLSDDDREAKLPESWNSSMEVPEYDNTTVAYGIADLEETVARLPFSLEWLHPDWSSSVLNEWDLTASTTETTQGSAPASPDGFAWTWKTTVNHIPYATPNDVPFKCLSHMRTDDPTVTVKITNDNNKTIRVETAPTPVSAPRTADENGSIRDYHGTKVRCALYGAAYDAGWALAEFSIPYKYGLDYSTGTGSGAYGRDGKTQESIDTIGCLVNIPDKDSKYISANIYNTESLNADWAWFIPDVNWGDKEPTYWHANGFPKGLDSVLSPKLKTQLETLCPVCQPAIPPAVPAFWSKFPDAGRLPWDYDFQNILGVHGTYPRGWMQHLALACTPLDMSARLDAMTTTVHRVPTLFAKIRTVTTKYSTTRDDYIKTSSDSPVEQSWSMSTKRDVVTVEGTSGNPIPAGDSLRSVSGKESGVENSRTMYRSDSSAYSVSDKTQYTWEESFESNSDFLVCLRSTTNTTLSTKITTKTSETKESSSDDPYSSEEETQDGELPESYDPDPDNLLFPDWVLPWIEKAELFASIESRLMRNTGADYTTSNYYYDPADGKSINSYSGSGSGTRTHKTQRKIISLGLMDMSTGRFPAIDAAAIISEVDPDPTEPTTHQGTSWRSFDRTTTETYDSNNNHTIRTVEVVKDNVRNNRSRSVSYYVIVRWKFDRTDPKTLATELPLADLYRKLADAKKALSDKERELSDAESALKSAQSDLESANNALTLAQKRLADPEGAEATLLSEAQDALDRANQKLSDAQSEKSEAQAEYSAAESALQAAESALQPAQAEYDAAVEAAAEEKERVEEAMANLKSAQASLESAQSELSEAQSAVDEAQGVVDEAQANLETAQSDLSEAQGAVDEAQTSLESAQSELSEAQGAVEEAQGAVDEAQASLESAQSELSEAQGAVDEAQGAVDEAQASLESAQSELSEAQSAVDEAQTSLESAQSELSEAQGAVEEAQGAVDEAQASLESAQSELSEAQGAVDEAQGAVDEAQAAYDAAVESGEGIEEALDNLKSAQASLDSAQSKLSEAQGAVDEAQVSLDSAQSELSEAQGAVDEAQGAVDEAQAGLESAQSELSEAQSAVDEAQGAVDEAQASLESAQSELSEAQSAVDEAQASLDSAQSELSEAQSAVDEAQGAVDEAQASLESAQSELSEAQSAVDEAQGMVDEAQASLESAQPRLSEAQSAVDEAQSVVDEAQSVVDEAQAAYDAVVGEAQAALESAYTAYYEAVEAYGEASSKLADAEANETIAQLDADAAQEYYDTLLDKIEEILQKAVDDAQAAVDEATSRVDKWTEKIKELKDAIEKLKAEVKKAEQAIRDAGGKVT